MKRSFASSYRLVLVCVLVMAAFTGIGVRLVYLQVIDRDRYVAEVERTRLAGRISLDLVAKYEDSIQHGELNPIAYPDQSSKLQVGVQFSVPVFAGGALQSTARTLPDDDE